MSSNWSFCAYDSRQQLVVGINTEELEIYEKTENDSSGWRRRASVKIDRAQETIYVGVV